MIYEPREFVGELKGVPKKEQWPKNKTTFIVGDNPSKKKQEEFVEIPLVVKKQCGDMKH